MLWDFYIFIHSLCRRSDSETKRKRMLRNEGEAQRENVESEEAELQERHISRAESTFRETGKVFFNLCV